MHTLTCQWACRHMGLTVYGDKWSGLVPIRVHTSHKSWTRSRSLRRHTLVTTLIYFSASCAILLGECIRQVWKSMYSSLQTSCLHEKFCGAQIFTRYIQWKCLDVMFKCSLDLSSSLMESVTWKEVSLDLLGFACCDERNGNCQGSETSLLASQFC